VIWSDRPRLALSIGAATIVPVVALTWLGLRVFEQEREIERQHHRDRLEVAAAACRWRDARGAGTPQT
jgi:hypothetical protein